MTDALGSYKAPHDLAPDLALLASLPVSPLSALSRPHWPVLPTPSSFASEGVRPGCSFVPSTCLPVADSSLFRSWCKTCTLQEAYLYLLNTRNPKKTIKYTYPLLSRGNLRRHFNVFHSTPFCGKQAFGNTCPCH